MPKVNPPVTVNLSMTIPEPVFQKLLNLCKKHGFSMDEVMASSLFAEIFDITTNNAFQDPEYRKCTRETIATMRKLYSQKLRHQFHDA